MSAIDMEIEVVTGVWLVPRLLVDKPLWFWQCRHCSDSFGPLSNRDGAEAGARAHRHRCVAVRGSSDHGGGQIIHLATAMPEPTWDDGDPRPRWQAGEWATRFHPKRAPQTWTVALEYGDPDHCWWMSPGEARALAAALLAAAAWGQEEG